MRTVRRILVAVKDPQARSLPSITKATQLARAWGAKLELFHGLDTPLYIDTAGTPEGFRGLARELKARSLDQLEAIASRVRRHGVQATTAAEWDFPIYEAIVRRARRMGADLIVTECKTGRRIAPLLLRLTDWELLQLSPVPVLVVKSARPYRHPAILAAVDPMHAHAKPSRLDDEILSAGAAVQYALRGTLHAVHSYLPLPVGTPLAPLPGAEHTERLVREIESAARDGFDRALRKANIPQSRRHLIPRHPQEAIPLVARKTGSSIVVMGAISRRGLKRVFIGNTAEQLLDELSCDVLVVKPRKFVSRVPAARRGMRLIAPQPFSPFGY